MFVVSLSAKTNFQQMEEAVIVPLSATKTKFQQREETGIKVKVDEKEDIGIVAETEPLIMIMMWRVHCY